MKSAKPHRPLSLRLVARLAYLLAVASSFLVVVGLAQSGVVPLRYVLAVLAGYATVLTVLGWLAFRRTRSHAVLGGVLAVALLLSGANVYAYTMGRSVQDFLGAVQQPQASYVEYSIFAHKDRPVSLDTAQTMSMISSDPLYVAAREAAARETPAEVSVVSDLTSLTEQIRTDATQLATARSAYLEVLRENNPEFYESVVVLGTFRVKGDSAGIGTLDVSKPFVVYISGIDTYGDIGTSSRSDVNMLAVVNPAKRTMLLVNTPRDYYVQLHGTAGTPDKLTHAGIYGIHTSRQTLEDLYEVEIPHYMRVNFTSLVKLIDTIGPIEVQSDYAFKDFQAGPNTLDSKRALEFARERYSFADGDRQRGKNQQLVIEAIVAKLGEPGNITRYPTILGTLRGSLQTDISQESLKELVRLQLGDMKRWQVESISVDGTGAMLPTHSMGSQPLYVMVPDQNTVQAARSAILDSMK